MKSVYQYEVYAPGDINVSKTIGHDHTVSAEQEDVAFVNGIATRYIQSAQEFRPSTIGERLGT